MTVPSPSAYMRLSEPEYFSNPVIILCLTLLKPMDLGTSLNFFIQILLHLRLYHFLCDHTYAHTFLTRIIFVILQTLFSYNFLQEELSDTSSQDE